MDIFQFTADPIKCVILFSLFLRCDVRRRGVAVPRTRLFQTFTRNEHRRPSVCSFFYFLFFFCLFFTRKQIRTATYPGTQVPHTLNTTNPTWYRTWHTFNHRGPNNRTLKPSPTSTPGKLQVAQNVNLALHADETNVTPTSGAHY